MPNNKLQKEIFIIYKTDQQSNYCYLQRAITNQKLH